MQEAIPPTSCLALGLFLGCRVRTPVGASPCKPVSLSRMALLGETSCAGSAACLSCVLPGSGGPRETTVLVVSLTSRRFLSVWAVCVPLECSRCLVGSPGR